MRQCCRRGWWVGPILLIAVAAEPGGPLGCDDWKFDVVLTKSGRTFRGLVVENTADRIVIRCVSRKPGAPTVVITETFAREDIDRIELLSDADRVALHRRLQALARERARYVDRLTRASDDDLVHLEPVSWPSDKHGSALCYRGKYFQLISNARPELVRFAVVELEQVYAAYARALPPRAGASQPTTILLFASLDEYGKMVRDRGYDLLNPAFFDTARNQVVCASELQRLADDNARVRREDDGQREAIRSAEAQLRKAYRDRVPAEQMKPLDEARKNMQAIEERNAAALELARHKLFQRLYHEAFHAYVATCVYSDSDGGLPRWLNEGLAQIFETAIVEAGELRIGHFGQEPFEALRSALKRQSFLPLQELLHSGPKDFLVARSAPQLTSDRYYLAARSLAFYVTFERKLLRTRQLDAYVAALRRGRDPVAAFEELVGQQLPSFEKEFRAFLELVRPDGTTGAVRR